MRSARVRSLACVGLLAFVVGAAVQITGALDGLERGAQDPLRHPRRASVPTTWSWSRSTPRRSTSCASSGRSRVRCTARSSVAFTPPAPARSSTTSSSPSPPSPARTSPSTAPSAPPGAPCSPPARATPRGHTNVLGGDANLRRVHAEAAASRPAQRRLRRDRPLPAQRPRTRHDRRGSRPPCRPARAPGGSLRRWRRAGSTIAARPARSAPSRSPMW